MSSGYAMSDDEDLDINSPIDLGNELADQETTDVIDAFSRVPFIVKKASVRKQYADSNDKTSSVEVTRLVIDAAIDSEGVDGEGKYANKHIFSELVLSFNRATHSGEWWEKRARGPAKLFFTALGFDVAEMPTIDAEFLVELKDRDFVGDIRKVAIQKKVVDGNGAPVMNDKSKPVYADTGDFKNELQNFRAS